MRVAAAHVDCQLPTEHTRVGYLLDSIESKDAALNAAIASVEEDQGPTGKRNDFESAVSHILPKDPVQRKKLAAAAGGKVSVSALDDGGAKRSRG